jgi:hypothetical protein
MDGRKAMGGGGGGAVGKGGGVGGGSGGSKPGWVGRKPRDYFKRRFTIPKIPQPEVKRRRSPVCSSEAVNEILMFYVIS